MNRNEKSRLLGKITSNNEKWYGKQRWYILLLFFLLLLGSIYILYNIFDNSTQSMSYKTIKPRAPLHILSLATTNSDYLKQCAPLVICDPNAKYRSVNGSCNNLKTPTWGASETPFIRLFNANYSDGYNKLRVQANGSSLPNVRLLNIELFMGREKYRVDENNVLMMPFGQLLAHDLTGMAVDILISPQGVVTDCCLDENARRTLPQCIVTFDNPPDDPVYSKHGIRCQSKFRYQTAKNYSCPLRPSAYMNANTHFMDASGIYGSSDSTAQNVRMMEGGRLNFSTNDNGQMFCPYLEIKENQPTDLKYLKFQYDGGDPGSINQNIGITAMSTLFLRFHNYIAFRLSILNPFWSDEILFQESRRIVIGSIQRTAYDDFLPIIIGKDFQELFGLNEENIYDSNINPSISLEWSSAAYRVLHTIIPVQFNFMNSYYNVESSMIITDWMSDPHLLPIGNNFDKLIKGFLETAGRVAQPSYNFFISNFMFHTSSQHPYEGFDLMSGDIMAGRDVGLQPYNRIRNLCGLPLAANFDDLLDFMDINSVNKLKKHYDTVDDIDLMVGLLLEKPSDGALVGPTSQCLIADSFYRTKAGDRFFYDVRGQPSSFTSDQLKAIKKITLGHVICASTNVDHVQMDIFKIVDHTLFPTSKLKCDDEFYIDLNAWKQMPHKSEL